MPGLVAVAIAAVAVAGCQRSAKPSQPVASEASIWASGLADDAGPTGTPSRPPRTNIVAVFDMPSGDSLGTLPQVVDFFAPGASAQLNAQGLLQVTASAILNQTNIAGLDTAQPVRLALLDPKAFSTPVIIVAAVLDPDPLDALGDDISTLYNGDYVMIGDTEALSTLSGDERDFLTWLPSLKEPELILFVRELATLYRAELMEFQRDMVTAMLEGNEGPEDEAHRQTTATHLIARLMTLLNGCDRLIVRGQMVGGIGQLEAQISFLPDSTMAHFTRAQSPAKHEILSRMPPRNASDPLGMLLSGTLSSGPLRDWWLTLISEIIRSEATGSQASPVGSPSDVLQAVTSWSAQLTGSLVYTAGRDSSGTDIWLLGASDDDAAMDHSRTIESLTTDEGIVYYRGAERHDGVVIDVEFPTSGVGPDTATGNTPPTVQSATAFAGFDGHYANVIGAQPVQGMKQVIDAVRGKQPRWSLEATVRDFLDRSRARRDSLFLFFDRAYLIQHLDAIPLSAAAMVLGLAFAPETMTLTLELSK